MNVVLNGQTKDIGQKSSLSYSEIVRLAEETRGKSFALGTCEYHETAWGIRLPGDGKLLPAAVTVTWKKSSGHRSLVEGQYITTEDGMVLNATATDKA
jgi:hypothetical protein